MPGLIDLYYNYDCLLLNYPSVRENLLIYVRCDLNS